MLTADEAITIGYKKYRELYPKGEIPAHVEENGVLGATPNDSFVMVHVTFWFEGENEPFYLFQASVDRATGNVSVLDSKDWHVLEDKTFDSSQSL
jgi:hypothetical protein